MNDVVMQPLVADSGSITIHRGEGPRLMSSIFFAVYAIAALVGMIGGFVADLEGAVVLTSLASFCLWPLVLMSYIFSLSPRWSAGTIEVRLVEVIVTLARGHALRFGRGDIVGALVVDRAVGGDVVSHVELELRSADRISIAVADEALARKIVDRLGFGPGGARVKATVALPSRRLLHPVLGLLAWITGLVMTLGAVQLLGSGHAVETFLYTGLWPFLNLVLYFALRRALRAPTITVGEDGVAVEQGLLSRAVMARHDGDLPVDGTLLDTARVRALAKLAVARDVATAASDEAIAAFGRAGRTLGAWRAELATKMDRGGYRSAASGVETATAVLRSPRATPDQRVGAAVALRVAGEPPEKIRVAADAVADEDLRAALLAVADDGDDETLERRLRTIGRAENRR